MFKSLEIKNFKSIGHAVFDLGTINVLTGQSNLGKSNVVQAIYCLTHNHWDSNYQKWGTKKCSVKLTDENDQWVEYSHEGSSATYRLSYVDQPFTKIGRDVPVPVQEFLKMNLVQFDEDLALDFNFERQFDPSFVISLSGFELAKVFGKLMNLDIVMSAARTINKDLAALKREAEGQEAIQNVSIEFIEANYAIELKYALLHQAMKIDAEVEKKDQEIKSLGDLIASVDFYQDCCSVYENYLNSESAKQIDQIRVPMQGLDSVLCNLETSILAQKEYERAVAVEIPTFDFEGLYGLSTGLSGIVSAVSSEIKLQKAFDSLANVDFGLADSIRSFGTVVMQADGHEKDIENYCSAIHDVEGEVTRKATEFKEFLKENNICPISGKPFAKGCAESIVKSVI